MEGFKNYQVILFNIDIESIMQVIPYEFHLFWVVFFDSPIYFVSRQNLR